MRRNPGQVLRENRVTYFSCSNSGQIQFFQVLRQVWKTNHVLVFSPIHPLKLLSDPPPISFTLAKYRNSPLQFVTYSVFQLFFFSGQISFAFLVACSLAVQAAELEAPSAPVAEAVAPQQPVQGVIPSSIKDKRHARKYKKSTLTLNRWMQKGPQVLFLGEITFSQFWYLTQEPCQFYIRGGGGGLFGLREKKGINSFRFWTLKADWEATSNLILIPESLCVGGDGILQGSQGVGPVRHHIPLCFRFARNLILRP